MESGIQLLGKLNNLYHDLGIWGLQDIENPEDALETDLKNKTHLVNLKLGWKRTRNSIDSKKVEYVLENLQPSKNLKVLSIFNYGGNKFPKWLIDNSLPNLVFLELGNCESCRHLPPLGLFSLLKKLKIIDSPRLVGSLKGAFGDSSSFESLEISELDAECFPYENLLPLSLSKLTIYGFPNLEKLDYKGFLNSLLSNHWLLYTVPNSNAYQSRAFLNQYRILEYFVVLWSNSVARKEAKTGKRLLTFNVWTWIIDVFRFEFL